MSGRGNVRSGKCLSGEMSSRGSVLRGSVRMGNCLFGEMSVGEVSVGGLSSGKCQSGNCPHTDIYVTLRIWVPYRFKKTTFPKLLVQVKTWQSLWELDKKKSNLTKKTSFQWQINEWGVVFMGLNWSFRWTTSKKFHLDKEFFSSKQWTSLGAIVLENSFLGFRVEFKFLKSLICHI